MDTPSPKIGDYVTGFSYHHKVPIFGQVIDVTDTLILIRYNGEKAVIFAKDIQIHTDEEATLLILQGANIHGRV